MQNTIDNDVSRFTEKVLRAWKEIAEDRALSSIGKNVTPVAESESQRKLPYILPWKGKNKLSEMSTGNAVIMIGPVRGSSFVQVLDCTEFYVRVGKTGNESWSRSIALANIEICFDEAHNCLELQERHV